MLVCGPAGAVADSGEYRFRYARGKLLLSGLPEGESGSGLNEEI